jgi:hypothetical protein
MNVQQEINDERAKLMTVEALLHCAQRAMDNSDDHGPDYAAVISVARSILNDALNQLDRLAIRHPRPAGAGSSSRTGTVNSHIVSL